MDESLSEFKAVCRDGRRLKTNWDGNEGRTKALRTAAINRRALCLAVGIKIDKS
jgi:hypothetical protein